MGLHAMYNNHKNMPPAKKALGMWTVRFTDPETGEKDHYDYFHPTTGGGPSAEVCARYSAELLEKDGIATTIEYRTL